MIRSNTWSAVVLFLGALCGVVWIFWPPPIEAVRFWDTYEYLLWPKPEV